MKKALKSSDKLHVQIIITVWVTVCVIFCLIPLFITFLNAFKSSSEIEYSIFAFPKWSTLGSNIKLNFSEAWSGGVLLSNTSGISAYFARTILLALIGGALDCILGAILGYIFTYKEFHFKEGIFLTFIAVMMLPAIMGMPILVPFMKNTLGLADTYIGYLLPNIAGGQVGALFLFRTFFGQQPKSIYESAQIEGANDLQILCRLTGPLAFPIILYKFVGTFGSLYNDYLWPSLIMTENQLLMPQMLQLQVSYSGDSGLSVTAKGAMYAMYILSSIPLIFTSAISMKFFSSGDFAAGIKL